MISGLWCLAEQSGGLQPPDSSSRWQGEVGKPEPAPGPHSQVFALGPSLLVFALRPSFPVFSLEPSLSGILSGILTPSVCSAISSSFSAHPTV